MLGERVDESDGDEDERGSADEDEDDDSMGDFVVGDDVDIASEGESDSGSSDVQSISPPPAARTLRNAASG